MEVFVWVLFRDVNVMESGPTDESHSGQGLCWFGWSNSSPAGRFLATMRVHDNCENIQCNGPFTPSTITIKDNYICNPHQWKISSVYSKSTLVCPFFSRSLYQKLISIGCWCIFSFISWKKNLSESDFNYIIYVCLYRYSCRMDSAIL